MQKETKTAPSVQVTGAAKVKSTKATKNKFKNSTKVKSTLKSKLSDKEIRQLEQKNIALTKEFNSLKHLLNKEKPTVTTGEGFHYFTQSLQHNKPLCAMDMNTAVDFHNSISRFFQDTQEGLKSYELIFFDILKYAVSNKECEDDFSQYMYVEAIGDILQLLKVCNQINLDTLAIQKSI